MDTTRAEKTSIAIVLLLGLILRLLIATSDINVLLEKNLPDDSFYYFQIAKNIGDGNNVVFNRGTLTNGFHPLWLAVVTLLFKISDLAIPGDGLLPIHFSLLVGAFLDTLTALVILRLSMRSSASFYGGMMAAIVYFFHPRVVLESVNGLETSLSTLLIGIAALQYVRLGPGSDGKHYVLFGATTGLMTLARTDSGILLTVFFLFLFARIAFSRHKRDLTLRTASAASTAGLVLAPWFVWNLRNFGDVIQTSGKAIPYTRYVRFAVSNGGNATAVDWVLQSIRRLYVGFFEYVPRYYLLVYEAIKEAQFLFAGVVIGMILMYLYRQRAVGRRFLRQLAKLLPLLVFAVLLIMVHSAIRWALRPWYFVPLVLTLALMFGLLCSLPVFERLSRSSKVVIPIFITVTYVVVLGRYWHHGLLPWQRDMYSAALWIDATLEADERIASFNTGIHNYFSEKDVLNLDGVVNPDAFQAIRERQLSSYLRDQNVDYVVDFTYFIDYYGPFLGSHVDLHPLNSVHGRSLSAQSNGLSNTPIRIYQVVERADSGTP